MTTQQVQANSVIYERSEYIAVLADAKRSLSILKDLRQAQIDEWKSDTAAREADLNTALLYRFTKYNRDEYKRYLEKVKNPPKLSWWQLLLGQTRHDDVDRYGSLEAFTEAKTGQTFAEFKAETIAYYQGHELSNAYDDNKLLNVLGWVGSIGKFIDNEWEFQFNDTSRKLWEVTESKFDAQFVIPRETFDIYAQASIKAATGKVDPVVGDCNYYDYWDF